MLFLLSERKSFANKLMPLLWQKNGTKTKPCKIRSNYRLDNSSCTAICLRLKTGIKREEPRQAAERLIAKGIEVALAGGIIPRRERTRNARQFTIPEERRPV